MSIIEKLFEGELSPEVCCREKSVIYLSAQDEMIGLVQNLDKKTADALIEQYATMERESTCAYFKLGFRWGVQFIIEALREIS